MENNPYLRQRRTIRIVPENTASAANPETPRYMSAIYSDGTVRDHSTEEIIANGMNRFQGWTCNVGVQTLYIDYDGSVWVGNCAGSRMNPNSLSDDVTKEWGYVGSIVDDRYTWPLDPVICPYDSCGCGADVATSKKARNVRLAANDLGLIQEASATTPIVALGMNYDWPKHILWDLGRWCNYSCSYCWPAVHNKTDPHKKLDMMKKVVDRVHESWSLGKMIRWSFGGGEPTVNPDFLPLIKYIKSRGDYVMTVSNGSRSIEYYQELAANVDCLQLSLHSEFYKPEQFRRNVDAVLGVFRERGGWLDIKIMCKPGFVSEGIRLMREFNAMISRHKIANGPDLGSAACVPIRDINDGGKLTAGYNDSELRLLLAL